MTYRFTITVDIDSDTDVPMAALAGRLAEVAEHIGNYEPDDFECGRILRRLKSRTPLARITATIVEDFDAPDFD